MLCHTLADCLICKNWKNSASFFSHFTMRRNVLGTIRVCNSEKDHSKTNKQFLHTLSRECGLPVLGAQTHARRMQEQRGSDTSLFCSDACSLLARRRSASLA